MSLPRARALVAGVVVAASAVTLTGCDLSPIELEASASLDRIGFVVGDPIVGRVDDAHGTVKVSLVPAPLVKTAPTDDLAEATAPRTGVGVACTVADNEKYSCPTVVDGDPLHWGRYLVRITDHDQDYGDGGVAHLDIPWC